MKECQEIIERQKESGDVKELIEWRLKTLEMLAKKGQLTKEEREFLKKARELHERTKKAI